MFIPLNLDDFLKRGILVPINFRLQEDEIAYIIKHSGASLLLYDPELSDLVAKISCPHRMSLGAASDDFFYSQKARVSPWKKDEKATATINYTSGTTAHPKGVELTHRNLWLNTVSLGLHLGLDDRDVYLHSLPMFHCNGWGLPFVLAGLGIKQIVLRKVDGREILHRIEQHGVSLLCGAPTVVNMILDAAKTWQGPIPGRGKVRILVAGAPPSTRTIERVETELGWEFIQLYGLTETSPLLTINRQRFEWDGLSSTARAHKLARAGVPAIGVNLAINDEGEVLARSNVVMQGYWQEPEASKLALREDWFHTGDGAYIDDDAYLCLTDRKKDVIISGGENISSIEVEDTLCSHPAVAEAAVIGVPDETWGESVKALIVLNKEQNLNEASLIAYCRERLAHYKCPKSIEFRSELSRTATGKLQKFKLRAPYWIGYTRQVH
ncbi:MAG: AMP-binding protein [Proteobacteria bacterium]|nr:AMP-binding protein [Pseudomonadota bacterium]